MARQPRKVIRVMEGTQIEEDVWSGLPSDELTIVRACALDTLAQSAWLAWKEGKPHEPLIASIHVFGLHPSYRGQTVWRPGVAAAMRWARLGGPPADVEVYRYDTAAGRTIRSRTESPLTRAARYQRRREHLTPLTPVPLTVHRWRPPNP